MNLHFIDKVDNFLMKHASFFLVVCIITLLLLFVGLTYVMVGVSALESGNYYNHLENIVYIKGVVIWFL